MDMNVIHITYKYNIYDYMFMFHPNIDVATYTVLNFFHVLPGFTFDLPGKGRESVEGAKLQVEFLGFGEVNYLNFGFRSTRIPSLNLQKTEREAS